MSASSQEAKKVGNTEHHSENGVGKENIIYTQRFSEKEQSLREATWRILCQDFFSK